MDKTTNIKWRSKPQKHDYPAADSYLSLTLGQQAAKNAADELERAEMSEFAAKDIFRASKLALLGVSNSHVEKDRAKIIRHEKLPPSCCSGTKTTECWLSPTAIIAFARSIRLMKML